MCVKRTFLTWCSCLWILDKDRELAEAYTEIKTLKSTERLKEKAFEEVIPQYSCVCGYGRLAPSSTFDRTVARFLVQKVYWNGQVQHCCYGHWQEVGTAHQSVLP